MAAACTCRAGLSGPAWDGAGGWSAPWQTSRATGATRCCAGRATCCRTISRSTGASRSDTLRHRHGALAQTPARDGCDAQRLCFPDHDPQLLGRPAPAMGRQGAGQGLRSGKLQPGAGRRRRGPSTQSTTGRARTTSGAGCCRFVGRDPWPSQPIAAGRSCSSIGISSRSLRRFLNHSKRDFFRFNREVQYHGLPRKIIIEENILADGSATDYKFFCFGGRPMFCQVDIDRFGLARRSICSASRIRGSGPNQQRDGVGRPA